MVQKENESKLINGIKKLDKQMKKEEERKDMVEIMERKLDEFEDKVKKSQSQTKHKKQKFCQCGKRQKDCS